ncbi:substrate-binding periplasmic protein [Pseudoalteromonas sp. SSDWG2]|uniref:substrate-binding periplasmic protein n=1 Tax=Pseudoalteromonas sp. SSDWG2 TaxID=3139391 RepID=UPI003BAA0315
MQYIFALVLSFLCSANALAAPLKYNVDASGSWYPYTTSSENAPGLIKEFVIEVMQQANVDIQYVPLPAKRINQFMQNKQLDFEVISPSWLSEEEKNDPQFVFSDALFPVREYLVTTSAKEQYYLDIDSIFGNKVGTVRGYFYHDDEKFERVDFESERELIMALGKKRINVAIIGDLPAKYWSKKLGVPVVFAAEHSDGQLHLRLRAEHAHLLPKINTAISTLKSGKTLTRLEHKYLQHFNSEH